MSRKRAYLIYSIVLLLTIIVLTVFKLADEYKELKDEKNESISLNPEFFSPYPADDIQTHWTGKIEFQNGTILDSVEISLCQGRYSEYTIYALPTTSVNIKDSQGNAIVSSLENITDIFIPGEERYNERQLMMVTRMLNEDGISFPYDLSSIVIIDNVNRKSEPIIILADTSVSPGNAKVVHYSEVKDIFLKKK